MPDITSTDLSANPMASLPGAALGVAQSVVSLINAAKAKKEAKELQRTRPKHEISPEFGKNLSLVESELSGGMSNAAESAYNNLMNKQMSASIGAILRGGGDVNSVSSVFASGEEGRQKLAMLNDQLRLKQIDNVIKAREMMAGEQDKNFLFNEWMPWADRAQANSEARKNADKGIWSGLQTATSGLSNILSAQRSGNNNIGLDEPLKSVSRATATEGLSTGIGKKFAYNTLPIPDIPPPNFSTINNLNLPDSPISPYGYNQGVWIGGKI